MRRRIWLPGDPTPDFTIRATNNPRFHFSMAAGRYVVLCFYGSAGPATGAGVIRHVVSRQRFFDDDNAAFFGVSIDPADEAQPRVEQLVPGIRYFWDFDRTVSAAYGALAPELAPREVAVADAVAGYRGSTLILDPMLRVLVQIPHDDVDEHNRAFDLVLSKLPPAGLHAGQPVNAPILVLPRIFERDFCRELIDLYEAQGGQASGFMREIDGKTVGILDDTYKRRMDFPFDYQPQFETLRAAIRKRINSRLIPEIQRAFQFKATRMERYIVACYDGQSQGFFRAHRDNTTTGTAHRRFACTINLNAEDYDGGNLRFPEFGPHAYRAPTGGAVVFSCSLLHEATPVTRGRRYAFLPFLYDDAAAKIREKNAHALTGQTINANQGEAVPGAAAS